MKYLIVILILLTSCSSRKVYVDSTVVKKDSITEIKIEVIKKEDKTKTDSTNVKINTDESEVTFIPVDSTKEIVIEGKHYKNVILKIRKTKSNSIYVNNKKELDIKSIDSSITNKVHKIENASKKIKVIDKKFNYWILIWLLPVFVLIFILYNNKSLFMKIFTVWR